MADPISEFEIRVVPTGLGDEVKKLIDSEDLVYLVAVLGSETHPVIYARQDPRQVQAFKALVNVTSLKTAVLYRHQQSPGECCLNRNCWPC